MNVPFVDLKAQYLSIKEEIDTAIQSIIDRTAFIGGEEVKRFEQSFAESCDVKYSIGVGNGTDALFLTMKAMGIGQGDEVVTAANSFVATSEAISMTGARPVFVDCDPDTYNIDVKKLEGCLQQKANIGKQRVKAVIPVHLYGQPADMFPVMETAKKYNLKIIEDCAQAHFAEYKGEKVGGFGDAGCFSFYPCKNLGAYGDAGAVITNDGDLAQKVRMIANHGRMAKYDHEFEGLNSRMDGIQAAILNVKLKYISEWNKKRYKNALLYQKCLSNLNGIKLANIPGEGSHVFHLFVIRVKNRSELQTWLKERGVSTGVHYPIALPNLTAYRYLGYKPEDFPVANTYQNEILSLPMYPELTEEKIEYITDCLKDFQS